jgi:hypothetical protein
MTFDSVSVVKHLKTSKWFILLDEFNDRYRLINPEGSLVSLPMVLFDEEPGVLNFDGAQAELAAEQLAAYQNQLREQAEKAAMERHVTQIAKDRPQVYEAPARPTPKSSSSGSRPRNVITAGKHQPSGVGASWTATTLVFYRPQIDRLSPKQSFRVIVDGVGEFVISKQDFSANFNDVILSPKFKAEGFFAYDKIPEKALRFLKK